MVFKLIITGGVDFYDLKRIIKVADIALLKKGMSVEIVSGVTGGADRLGEAYAYSRGFAVKRFPSDLKNSEMAEYADAAIIFWDKKSKEVSNMIDNMKKIGKPYIIKNY